MTQMKTLCRTGDAKMIANFRVQAELSAVESTEDGRAIVLGTVDGCVSALAIADPDKPEMKEFLAGLPSRDDQVSLTHLYLPIPWSVDIIML